MLSPKIEVEVTVDGVTQFFAVNRSVELIEISVDDEDQVGLEVDGEEYIEDE